MSELRKAFELWAVNEELDITSVDFSSGSIRATDHHGNQVQFCYEETETATAWYAWQEQQKKIDAVQAVVANLQEELKGFTEVDLYDKGYRRATQSIKCELEKALQGDTNA